MIELLLVLVGIVALVGLMIWVMIRLDTIGNPNPRPLASDTSENPLDDSPRDVLG